MSTTNNDETYTHEALMAMSDREVLDLAFAELDAIGKTNQKIQRVSQELIDEARNTAAVIEEMT